MSSLINEYIEKLRNRFKNVNHINDVIFIYEEVIRDITKLDDVTIFLVKDNSFYSPRFDKSFLLDSKVNSILYECYFTKKTHNIIDINSSFLYYKSIDNINNIDIKNITVIPILDNNNNTLAVIEIGFNDKNYLEDITKLIDSTIDILISFYEISDIRKYTPTILLVDDNFIMLKFLSSIIKKYDVNIITATSGLEGIEKFKYQTVDMIIIDDIMVGMSGHEAISIIRDIEREQKLDPIPIFGTTSNTIKEVKDKLIQSGANLVFYKPIQQEEIIEALKLFMMI